MTRGRPRRHHGHLEAPLAERCNEVGGSGCVIGCDEDLRLPGHEHVGVGGVVLRETIDRGLDDGAEDVEARLGCRHREGQSRDAGLQLEIAGGDRRAVRQQPQRGLRADRRAQPHHQVDGLADPCARRRIHRVDQHLRGRLVGRGHDVEPDAASCRRGNRVIGLPRRVVAIGQQDEPLLEAARQDRGSQADRGRNVGRADDRLGLGVGELIQRRWQPIDQRVRPEDDDPRRVALRHLAHAGPCPIDELLTGGVEHRGRSVEQEHDAQPVRRKRESRAGTVPAPGP